MFEKIKSFISHTAIVLSAFLTLNVTAFAGDNSGNTLKFMIILLAVSAVLIVAGIALSASSKKKKK